MLRHLILGLLRHRGPRHGYALMKEYRDASGREINVGNFYREFQRLQLDGLVRPVRNPTGADSRRVPYEITELGRTEFDAWLARPAPVVPVDYENEYSLRAFFVLQGMRPLAKQVLDNWFDELSAQRRVFQSAREEALHASSDASGARSATPTLPLWLERRLNHLAIDLEFIESLRSACTTPCADRAEPPCSGGPARTPSRRAC
jgi:DNA-binding PadR family transcriptional regulator